MGKIRFFVVLSVILAAAWNDQASSSHDLSVPTLLPMIQQQFSAWDTEAVPTFDEAREQALKDLAEWIAMELKVDERAELIFICTHNSRRSHMAQLWAAAAASHFGLEGVHTFSGGTEVTAMNDRTVAALRRAGFEIERLEEGSNPVYEVRWDSKKPGTRSFSKRYADPTNPPSGFGAVMTCSHADESCPIVYGADARFSLPYGDPKLSDGTEAESATYDARSAQIGFEMFVLMRMVNSALNG